MPNYCNIKECKKISKKKSKDTIPTLYLCAAHSKLFEEIEFVKIVNTPCRTCITENNETIKEASFGPIVNGIKKRWYCKKHIPNDKLFQKKVTPPRLCIFPECYITANFKNPVTKKIQYCKAHIPV